MYNSMYNNVVSVIQLMQLCSYLKIFPGKFKEMCCEKYMTELSVYPSQSHSFHSCIKYGVYPDY